MHPIGCREYSLKVINHATAVHETFHCLGIRRAPIGWSLVGGIIGDLGVEVALLGNSDLHSPCQVPNLVPRLEVYVYSVTNEVSRFIVRALSIEA